MRCMISLKDGGAMERVMGALAKYRYTAVGEPVAQCFRRARPFGAAHSDSFVAA